MDCLGIYDKEPQRPAFTLLERGTQATWMEDERCERKTGGTFLVLDSGHSIATVTKPDHCIVGPVEATDAELAAAARTMLTLMAISNGWAANPGEWFEERDLDFDRVIKIDGWDIAVTTPDFLGRLALYSDPRRGLGLLNANAAVLVMTDEAKRRLAEHMVQPLRCGGLDYKRGFVVVKVS